jgi:Skp family chaperone for outer membrane proteins
MPSRAGVAVVDLDAVAHRLGLDAQMHKTVQSQTELVQQKLAALEQNASVQLEEARRGLGAAPSTQDEANFRRMRQNAQVQLNQLKQKAEQELTQQRQQMVARFREDAKPYAARVARERGFSTIITRNETFLFSYDAAVDITDAVASLMRDELPRAAAAGMVTAPRTGSQTIPATDSSTPAKPVIEQVSHEEPARP